MKRTSLLWKLILAFMLVAVITALLLAVFIRLTSVDRLSRLIIDQQRSSLQTALSEYYTTHGSWEGVREEWPLLPSAFPTLVGTPSGVGYQPPPDFPGTPGRDWRRMFGLADAQGKLVVSYEPKMPADSMAPADVLKDGVAITVDGQQVGTLLTFNRQPRFNPEEMLFLQRTTEALIFAVGGAMIVALLTGILLARNLIRPLQTLTQAAQNIAQGQLDQQVNIRARDEIGQLADAFNHMSQEVAKANQLRRQMTADIAHDLRTPLTVIAGYIESMRDGVLQPTPQRLSLIYTEIERLQNLVNDLRLLSQADAGELPLHPQYSSPKVLLQQAVAPFQHIAEQCGVTLQVEAADTLPEINVDEARMMQVFGNLITNALRYTPTGGQIVLSARQAGENMLLLVTDTGEGIAPEELPYIFHRFHRADKSRHSETGEIGLGLAIVKALVDAHSGTVSAESQRGQGTTIIIAIPLLPAQNTM